METPPEPPPRFVDKRRRGEDSSTIVDEPPAVDTSVIEAGMAAQAKAAEEDAEPALVVTSFIILAIDTVGVLQVYSDLAQISSLINGGISSQRPAAPQDIVNMSAQLGLWCTGNEVAGRVMGALQQQAAQQVMSRMGQHGGLARG